MSGHVDPDRAQFDAFKALDRDRPIDMLNLVHLKARATYPAGHALAAEKLSGAQAYARYGRDTAPVLARVGGSIVWRGEFDCTLIGPKDQIWDVMFIARYPTAHAFLAMISDPDYRLAVVHRQAAVKTSRLLRATSQALAAGFA